MDDGTQRAWIVRAAREWIGTPYVHQASLRGAGADCLGLFRGVWREVMGPEDWRVPAYSPDWYAARNGDRLLQAARRYLEPVDAPDAGDVVLFRMKQGASAKHMGIVTDVESETLRFVHAYSLHGVVESPLVASWARRIDSYFKFPSRRA